MKSQVDTNRWGFLCVGSDQSTGDAIGPLVGSSLIEAGYTHVIGTLQAPLDASNVHLIKDSLIDGYTYIAIDAALGLRASIGFFQVSNQPLAPGKSVGKKLPPLGDFSIAAIVNESGVRQLHKLQTTSLYQVMTMSQHIVQAIKLAFPLNRKMKGE